MNKPCAGASPCRRPSRKSLIEVISLLRNKQRNAARHGCGKIANPGMEAVRLEKDEEDLFSDDDSVLRRRRS